MKYRKKPVVVEAMRYVYDPLGPFDGAAELRQWGVEGVQMVDPDTLRFHVAKSNATATIHPDDWIIKERDGSGFYPCTDAEFAATYESVEEE